MPPTNEEYRATALHAMVGLRAELRRALNGTSPSRSASRTIAAEMRELLRHAILILGEADVDEFDEHVTAARAETLKIFGTSGWDAAEGPPPNLPPLPRSSGKR
jgi:hypothetical protein